MELIGLYFVAALLLVAAGAAKAVRPGDTARALAAGALPIPTALRRSPTALAVAVRAGAAAEAVLGAAAVLWPGPVPATLVGASYLVFAGVLAVLRARGGALASCGCFGRPDTPVTVVHIVVDVVLAAAALSVAATSTASSILRVLSAQPAGGAPLAVASLVGAWLTLLVMDELSRLVAVRRLVGTDGRARRRAVGSTP
jgi:hypothetical protein